MVLSRIERALCAMPAIPAALLIIAASLGLMAAGGLAEFVILSEAIR